MASLDDVAQAMEKMDKKLGVQDEQQRLLHQMLHSLGETVAQRHDKADVTASRAEAEPQNAVTDLDMTLMKASEMAASANADLKARTGLEKGQLGGGLPNPNEKDHGGPDNLHEADNRGEGGWITNTLRAKPQGKGGDQSGMNAAVT